MKYENKDEYEGSWQANLEHGYIPHCTILRGIDTG